MCLWCVWCVVCGECGECGVWCVCQRKGQPARTGQVCRCRLLSEVSVPRPGQPGSLTLWSHDKAEQFWDWDGVTWIKVLTESDWIHSRSSRLRVPSADDMKSRLAQNDHGMWGPDRPQATAGQLADRQLVDRQLATPLLPGDLLATWAPGSSHPGRIKNPEPPCLLLCLLLARMSPPVASGAALALRPSRALPSAVGGACGRHGRGRASPEQATWPAAP